MMALHGTNRHGRNGTMSSFAFTFHGANLAAMPSGALWWAQETLLVVSDLHLGKSERMARRGGSLLPPYEVDATLARLDADICTTGARKVVCLGDTFDDLASAELHEDHALWIAQLMSGRRWVWIEGNHDPGPVGLGGEHCAELALGPLRFRHIAVPGESQEISGHYHPKARLAGQTRPCFLRDSSRVILPAYGTYTGGLVTADPALAALMEPGALAVLTGRVARAIPRPR
jgi:DNA ligase-associated metallophosphoesterase